MAAKPASEAPEDAPAAAGRATLLVMSFVLLSRVLGVVRDIVLGHLFGRNVTTDIYTAAFRIPDVLQYLVAGGALSTVFVPVFTEYWTRGQKKDAWHIFGAVIAIVGAIAAALVVVMEVLAAPLARSMNPFLGLAAGKAATGSFFSLLAGPGGAPQAQLDAWTETARLSRILLPAQWCFFVGGLMMGTLNARRNFLIPAIGPLAYNGGIILAGLLLHKKLGIASLCWGAFVGAIAGNFLLPVFALKNMGGRFPLSFDTRHPGVRKVGALMLPALLGLSLSQLGFWITGSFTQGKGALSALRNAYNLTQAPIGIFAQASAIVLFPTIAALAARQDWKTFRQEIHFGIRRILFLTVPASLLMAVLAEPIVAGIYLGGKFTPRDVTDTASALWCYSLGTFAWSAQAVLARGFYARQNSRTPVIITTAMVFFFALLCTVLPKLFPPTVSYLGLALALSIAGTVNMVLFFAVLQRQIGGLGLLRLAKATARIVLAALISCAVAWLFLKFFWHGPTTRTAGILTAVCASVAALAAYVAACLALHIAEIQGALAGARKLLRKVVR